MKKLPPALEGLNKYNQFVLYQIIPSLDRPGKTDKIPVDYRTGRKINPYGDNALSDFTTLSNMLPLFNSQEFGIGFIITENDPFFFVDIDECFVEGTRQWSDVSKDICLLFNGAAVEVSTSRKGLHILGTYTTHLEHNCRNRPLNLEFYTQKRLVALTGFSALGNVNKNCDSILPPFIDKYFKGEKEEEIPEGEWNDYPHDDWEGFIDDNILIDRALNQKSLNTIFNGGADFKSLWEANAKILSQAYVSSTGKLYDASGADSALAMHLAFWTGNHHERIKNLMLKSSLNRTKWNRDKYLRVTIQRACRKQTNFFKMQKIFSPAFIEIAAQSMENTHTPNSNVTSLAEYKPAEITEVKGTRLVAIQDLDKIFSGCVYVCDEHKILLPGGDLLGPDQFKAMLGGFTFALDTSNQKFTPDAFKAFTQSQAKNFPKVSTSFFNPKEAPGLILIKDGKKSVNCWWPINTPRKDGDVSPFLDHLKKMISDDRDRLILLSYMSAIVQYPGEKFQWCPVIQGVEGNGKSFLAICIMRALGLNNVWSIQPQDLANNFNSWARRKLFIWIEDILPGELTRGTLQRLQTMITSRVYRFEPKGRDQRFEELFCNFMLNSNHKDGIKKTHNDRRFSVFYTLQQQKEDLKRCGMTQQYFKKFNEWLVEEGYAIICNYLHTFQIPNEFHPLIDCIHAPTTSSSVEAAEFGLDMFEIELKEAVAEGVVGFRGGWISSIMLDRWMVSRGLSTKINRNRRKITLDNLGYIPHPSLDDGRLTTYVMPDGGKPRLYIHRTHPHAGLLAGVEQAYFKAQTAE